MLDNIAPGVLSNKCSCLLTFSGVCAGAWLFAIQRTPPTAKNSLTLGDQHYASSGGIVFQTMRGFSFAKRAHV
jgi:hypothetical protein